MNKKRSGQFMQKVVGDVGTAMAAAMVLAGDRAGLFKAMAGAGALRATDLAARCGLLPLAPRPIVPIPGTCGHSTEVRACH